MGDVDKSEEAADDGLGAFAEGKFYRGTLLKLQRGRQKGVLRSAAGKEIPFDFIHVRLCGDRWRWEDLHEGMSVGYDVGWTAHGLRVTTIRPLD
jgi:hypothetical protein